MSRAKKALVGVAVALVVLVVVATAAVFALFGHELKTLGSIEKVNDYPLYTMTYDGDYGIDEFIEQGGASNDGELIEFVVNRIMKGLPITIELPDLACSTFNATTAEGDAIFGRNFDLEYSPGMLVRCDPDDGYASVSMVNLGFFGLWQGQDARRSYFEPDGACRALCAARWRERGGSCCGRAAHRYRAHEPRDRQG